MLIEEACNAGLSRPVEPGGRHGLAASSPWDVQRIRDTLPRFVLPEPQAVNAVVGQPRLACEHERALQGFLLATEAGQWPATGARLRLDAALASLGGEPPAGAESTDPHDAYFHIARTTDDPSIAYLRGVVSALAVWLDELTDEPEWRAHAAIGDALLELWQRALGLPALPAAHRQPWETAPSTAHPVRRWLRGHHVFAVLTQGLIWTLNRLERLGETAPADQVIDLLGLMTRLYRASAVAFRFTAHFDPQVYADVIRPSMSEPHVPPGFSGSMSVDHGHLVALLSKQRGLLAACGARFPGVYGQLREALSEVYDCHRHVCERFVSPEGPSLRTDRLCGDNAAVTMIDRFKARRLDMLR